MGTQSSRTGCSADEKVFGLVVAAQEPSCRDDQVDVMECDPPVSVPSGRTCAVDGEALVLDCLKGNLKASEKCGALMEGISGSLPLTPSMFNNSDVDGTSRRGYVFSEIVAFVQRFPTDGQRNLNENSSFSTADIVRYLEDKTDENSRAASWSVALLNNYYLSQVTVLTAKRDQQAGKIQELSNEYENISKELSAAQAQETRLKTSLDPALSEIQDCRNTVQLMQAQLEKESRQIQELRQSRDSIRNDMIAQITGLEAKLRQSQQAGEAKQREVDRLNFEIGQKQKDLRHTEAIKIQLTSECQKLKAQLATIEQKFAQESLTSGSYADGHVNPSMVEIACKAVDKATDSMVRFLHDNSITSRSSLKAPELESFIARISSARPTDFSRSLHVKHVWGHWICATMFSGFEHVYFDVGRDLSSPLDFKKHAAECFQSFQKYKDVPALEYLEACPMFRAFCSKTYPVLFPIKLVHEEFLLAPLPQIVSFNRDGRFDGDGKLYQLFLDVAKAVWLLHKLSFSFDPPASILRMGFGTPIDKQYQESVIKDAGNNDVLARVVLMLRPAFRIRHSIIKSRVFLSKDFAIPI